MTEVTILDGGRVVTRFVLDTDGSPRWEQRPRQSARSVNRRGAVTHGQTILDPAAATRARMAGVRADSPDITVDTDGVRHYVSHPRGALFDLGPFTVRYDTLAPALDRLAAAGVDRIEVQHLRRCLG